MSRYALVEGQLEAFFLPAMLDQLGLPRSDLRINVAGGVTAFWANSARYNQAARHQVVLGLVDLEQESCAVTALKKRFPRGLSTSFGLRIAVRMLESWLLADREGIARFLGISPALVPSQPDEIIHPKRALVQLARRSRNRALRESLVPGSSGAVVGPEYVITMRHFIETDWSVERGRGVSCSLDSACHAWARLLG